MYELMYKIRHRNCPYNEISIKHPDAKIWHWCNSRTDFFEIRGNEARAAAQELKRFVRRVDRRLSLETHVGRAGGGLVLMASTRCPCYHLLARANSPIIDFQIDRFHCASIGPMIHQGGWEYHRIAAPKAIELNHFIVALGRMGEMEIVLKKKFLGDFAQSTFTVSIAELFGKLTEKQRRALVNALDNDYYAIPRRTTVGQLASAKGVPRTTYEEHLHKAESKVLESIRPYLRLYDSA